MNSVRIYVTKADGRTQEFDKEKIKRTCVRMGATQDMAESIANEIQRQAYNNIPTKKIIKMIFKYMRKFRPEFRYIIDLRDAICKLRPKPDFELFVVQMLKEYGFKVNANQFVSGRCVDHEIDAVAERASKDSTGNTINEVFYVEVKHHYKPHTYTGIDVFLEAQATFEDLFDGYKDGKNKIPFKSTIVVSNTKLSDHARRYAECRNIIGIAWRMPEERGLERMIEEKKLYPITFLRGLTADEQARLGDNNIVTVKQFLAIDDDALHRLTKIPKNKIRELKEKAREVLKNENK